jgi:hypothetical protein
MPHAEYVKDVHVGGVYVQDALSTGPIPILPTQPSGDMESSVLVIVLSG